MIIRSKTLAIKLFYMVSYVFSMNEAEPFCVLHGILNDGLFFFNVSFTVKPIGEINNTRVEELDSLAAFSCL